MSADKGAVTCGSLVFPVTEITLRGGEVHIRGVLEGAVPEYSGPVSVRGPDGELVASGVHIELEAAGQEEATTVTVRLSLVVEVFADGERLARLDLRTGGAAVLPARARPSPPPPRVKA